MVIVIGAGPTGLAIAYQLQQRGLSYRVLEQGAIGQAWRQHYASLHLNTLKQVSALPGYPMPQEYPDFPSAAQFVAYLEEYVRHFGLNVTTGVTVTAATHAEEGWTLQTTEGEVTGDTLLVATGIWSTPHVPKFGGEEVFGGKILHSRAYRAPEAYQGQRVLVIGAGNSGADIAAELGEHGVETAIAIRDGANFVARGRSPVASRVWAWLFRWLPKFVVASLLAQSQRTFEDLGIPAHPGSPLRFQPVVGFTLPETVATHRVTVYPCIERFIAGGGRFVDGREAPFDVAILATGYRPTVELVREAVECDLQGVPQLDGFRSTRNPHLYLVGFAYPVTEGFLQSLTHVTRDVVKAVATQVQAVY